MFAEGLVWAGGVLVLSVAAGGLLVGAAVPACASAMPAARHTDVNVRRRLRITASKWFTHLESSSVG